MLFGVILCYALCVITPSIAVKMMFYNLDLQYFTITNYHLK